MPHPRALTDEEAATAEQWFQEHERIGSVAAKAKELGVTRQTLYDAIRRVRGGDTVATRRKLTQFELGNLVATVVSQAVVGGCVQFHVERTARITLIEEPRQSGEQQLDDSGEK
jgi:hypothetical protein